MKWICLALTTLLTANGFGETNRSPIIPKDDLPAEVNLKVIQQKFESLDVPWDRGLTKEKIALGRRLFFDPKLSKDGTVSCASCHQPEHGFATPDPKAIGIAGQVGRRNAPSLINRVAGKTQFWDGRVATLQEQSLKPIANPLELGHSLDAVVESLKADADYRSLFQKAFANESETINSENLSNAIAAFEMTLLEVDSPVDQFQAGDQDALTDAQRQGLWIFESRGRCWQCHSGNNYSDELFHNTGIGFTDKNRDLGRFDVTKDEADKGKFKTPTLRLVSKTAPYMHDGSLKSLREVVEFYNVGGEASDPCLDQKMKPLGLSEKEIDHLVAFLEALSPKAEF